MGRQQLIDSLAIIKAYCLKQKNCKDCYLAVKGNGHCAFEEYFPHDLSFSALNIIESHPEGFAEGKNTIATPAVPSENVGSIIVTGRLKESPEEKLDKALARAGSTIAQGIMADIAKHDNVNSPKHYCKGGMEGIDVIKAAVSNLSAFEAVCVANIIKYVWRYKEKNGLEDLQKAAKYLEWLIEKVEKNEKD